MQKERKKGRILQPNAEVKYSGKIIAFDEWLLSFLNSESQARFIRGSQWSQFLTDNWETVSN